MHIVQNACTRQSNDYRMRLLIMKRMKPPISSSLRLYVRGFSQTTVSGSAE